jgi:hypothetical protein
MQARKENVVSENSIPKTLEQVLQEDHVGNYYAAGGRAKDTYRDAHPELKGFEDGVMAA